MFTGVVGDGTGIADVRLKYKWDSVADKDKPHKPCGEEIFKVNKILAIKNGLSRVFRSKIRLEVDMLFPFLNF